MTRIVKAIGAMAVACALLAGCAVILGSPSQSEVDAVVTSIDTSADGWTVAWSSIDSRDGLHIDYYMSVRVVHDGRVNGDAVLDVYQAIAAVIDEDYRYPVRVSFAEGGDPYNSVEVKPTLTALGFDTFGMTPDSTSSFLSDVDEIYFVLRKNGRL